MLFKQDGGYNSPQHLHRFQFSASEPAASKSYRPRRHFRGWGLASSSFARSWCGGGNAALRPFQLARRFQPIQL